MGIVYDKLIKDNESLQAQNKILREALEDIIEVGTSEDENLGECLNAQAAIAYEALESLKCSPS